jgi:dihydrofolate synthase/folylpolyglutamate synthase
VIQDPLLTVITGIALDHTAYLGDTVEAIAGEKAGIIKKNAPMIWGGYDAAARRVIAAAAEAAGVPFVAAQDQPAENVRIDLSGITLDRGELKDVHVPLLGPYQVQNITTVLALLAELPARGLPLSEADIRHGLATVRWPGRFEKLSADPLIISDGAHNPEGIEAAATGIRTHFPGGKVLLLTAVMADKDHSGMVATLAPLADEVFTLTPDNPRALPAAEYAAEFRAAGVPATGFDTVEEAVAAAVSAARSKGLPLISLGSLYMYAEVTDALERMGIL